MRFTAVSILVVSAFAMLAIGCPQSGASGGLDAGADARAKDAGSDALAANVPDAAAAEEVALPAATSEELTARARHLLEAVAHDNADLATDILFPRDAFIAAKDSADPGKAWDAKIIPAFRRHVHMMHMRTKGIEKAQYVSFELGHSVLQTTPKRKDWKRPLWHVKHSRITFTLDGRTQRLDIAEIMSWRGSWYVTKLR